jgi:hypothetical protein
MTDNNSHVACTNKLSSVQLKELKRYFGYNATASCKLQKYLYFNILCYLKYYFIYETNTTVYEACSVNSLQHFVNQAFKFLARSQICEKRLSALSCLSYRLSAYPRRTTPTGPIFTFACREKSSFIKIGEEE